MELFEEATKEMEDWHNMCQNADLFLPADEGMRVFDAVLAYTRDYDRIRVAEIINTGKFNRLLFVRVLIETFPDNKIIPLIASELYIKAPSDMLSFALALAHPGGGNVKIKFPEKTTNIPPELFGAFGLRSNELGWFQKLSNNERFVSSIMGSISPDHYKHIPLDITTLLLKKQKEATALQLTDDQGVSLW